MFAIIPSAHANNPTVPMHLDQRRSHQTETGADDDLLYFRSTSLPTRALDLERSTLEDILRLSRGAADAFGKTRQRWMESDEELFRSASVAGMIARRWDKGDETKGRRQCVDEVLVGTRRDSEDEELVGSKRVDEIDVVYASGSEALSEVFQLVGVDGRLTLNDAGMDSFSDARRSLLVATERGGAG